MGQGEIGQRQLEKERAKERRHRARENKYDEEQAGERPR